MKSKIKKIFSFAIFLVIIVSLFCRLTWLFRGNGIEAREDIVGFENIEESIDVVLYGGSNELRYYQPLVAYNEKGYTSYNYATSSAKVPLLKYYIEESRKTNEASLYVIDIRTITYEDGSSDDASVRNWSDSISVFSCNRFAGITSYLFNRDWEDLDIPSYYLDLIKYHSNYSALASSDQWTYTADRSSIDNLDKGFDPNRNHTPFEKPELTDVRGKLNDLQEDTLNELLDYCDENELQVLFICNPYVISDSDMEVLNTCGDIIESMGYTFVNFNEYYDEIGLDFSTDFGDTNHVNFLGAEKYTEYLMNYLSDNYDLPDHRGDEEYSGWDEDYIEYLEYQDGWRNNILTLVEDHQAAKEIADALPDIDDFSEWSDAIQNNNFTVIVITDGLTNADLDDNALDTFLEDYKIDETSSSYATVMSNGTTLLSSDGTEEESCSFGVDNGRGKASCQILLGNEGYLLIDDVDYLIPGAELQVLVYDNNYKIVADNVAISLNNGEIVLSR